MCGFNNRNNNIVETFEHLNSKQVYQALEKASKAWSEAQKNLIILDEGRKGVLSQCVLKHKKLVKTMSEAEHEARNDKEYKKAIENYALAEMELIKARYHYNNLDRYASLKQSELRRDLSLMTKQEG